MSLLDLAIAASYEKLRNVNKLLKQDFFARDARALAPALLGNFIRHGKVVVKITETESYFWPDDSANHCYLGKTKRNAPMWGPPGHAYIYLCYGIHNLLNFVCNKTGEGAAVLIRSCEAVEGHDIIRKRRNNLSATQLLNGPGKVGAALSLDTSFCKQALYIKGGIETIEGPSPKNILCGPRIGIDYAKPEHKNVPLRFAAADSLSVTHKKFLTQPVTK